MEPTTGVGLVIRLQRHDSEARERASIAVRFQMLPEVTTWDEKHQATREFYFQFWDLVFGAQVLFA